MSNPQFLAPNYLTQTASQYKANLDASIAANGRDYVNLGITYSAGVLTICGAGGSALASTNPAFVRFQSETAGLAKYISIEANQDIQDDAHATSQVIGNLFGMTTGVAVTVDVPFYIYACANDAQDTVSFALSRVPHAKVVPAVGTCGTPSSAVADTQGSFLFFDAVTVGDYDGNPCTCVGMIRMRMSTLDDWTVQALAVTDGIGQWGEETTWSMPLGQFGASASTIDVANGGTPPTWSTTAATYNISRSGIVIYYANENGDGGGDGAGAVTALMTIPYVPASASWSAAARHQNTGGNYRNALVVYSSLNRVQFYLDNAGTVAFTWTTYGNGARGMLWTATYAISLA